MTHERLWAPWRLDYIAEEKETPRDPDDCFLCRYCRQNDTAANFVVLREQRAMTVLNRYPYNNGHLLVAPTAHKASLEELDDEELLAVMHQITQMIELLKKVLTPDGFNVGLNLGKVAGAGLPGHLHWHIVPRWNGDTNFMPVLGGVKVIPQSLEALYRLLADELHS